MRNVYNPHPLMIDSGSFWRCDHGRTGLKGNLKWAGLPEVRLCASHPLVQVQASFLGYAVRFRGRTHMHILATPPYSSNWYTMRAVAGLCDTWIPDPRPNSVRSNFIACQLQRNHDGPCDLSLR